MVSKYFKIIVTQLDVKFMVPKKYHLKIINDSVKFQNELLKNIVHLWNVIWLNPKSTSHINLLSVPTSLAFKNRAPKKKKGKKRYICFVINRRQQTFIKLLSEVFH